MKQYILVAGVDYEFKGVNFRILCDNRMKRLINANKAKDDLRFITFDFRAGEIVTREVSYSSGKKSESASTVSRNAAITKANYDKTTSGGHDHFEFKDGQFDLMSVREVYLAAVGIGASDPGTLHELSFFSHAWMGGPILVNSYDDGKSMVTVPLFGTNEVRWPATFRDPDDKDPRAPKDFGSPTMIPVQLKQFQEAFHKDGQIWIWGCAFPRVDHEILHKLEHHKDYKSSGLPDGQKLTFTNFRSDHILALQEVLGVTFPDPKKVEIEFGQLRNYFCLDSQSSYSQQIADAARVHTFGGLMGTYSDYDKGVLPLMSVAKGFGRHLTFYQNYLGFKLDPEGRNYGEYKPGLSCPP